MHTSHPAGIEWNTHADNYVTLAIILFSRIFLKSINTDMVARLFIEYTINVFTNSFAL